MTIPVETSRKMWRTLEPIHGMIYFVPEAAAAYAEAGLSGNSRSGYFASRSAAMGAVEAGVVVATFFNFNPGLVRRCVPACWDQVSPATMVERRLAAADAALRRLLGDAVGADAMKEAAELAHRAATAPGLSPSGRPLYAGHAALRWPDEPHLALWHAISVLREYRGDGHLAALVVDGVDGLEALVIHAATGDVPAGVLQASRAWDDDEWAAGVARLRHRGWLDAGGALTEEGLAHRADVERRTDESALAPWVHLGADGCDRLRQLGRPFSKAIVESGALTCFPD